MTSVCNVCSRPSSSGNARLLRYPPTPARAVLLPFFFESSENAFPMTGMLSRLIHPPFGFSGRSKRGGSGGRMSRGDEGVALYFDAEHASHPQHDAWSVGC